MPGPPLPRYLRNISLLALASLLILCLVWSWSTANVMSKAAPARSPSQNTLVEPWQNAVDLASLAVTSEELRYARNAQTLADHEVHQAFQAALNQAQVDVESRRTQPEARRLEQLVSQRQQMVNQDQAAVKALAQPNTADEINTDLDLATAQLALDSDELKDAQQSLTRTLGDERGHLERDLAAHEAAVKKYDADQASKSLGAVATSRHYGTLLLRLGAWSDQRARYQAIEQAAAQTDAAIALLTAHRGQIQKPARSDSSADTKARTDAMKSASMYRRMRMLSADRIDNQKQLADTYRKWAVQVQLQHRIVFHLLIQSCALLLSLVLATLLLDTLIRYLFRPGGPATAKLGPRSYSIRVIATLSVQVIAALLLFLLIFGPPGQISTVLGLTTAGLTVVLQDFIISFCGWFVLMGKRGVRVGDWVEINGIGGEVVDIGLFRTALLESGNWTDLGHPTGRQITFPNSFAIKGQYFNFTTNGQWMWDELSLTVPAAEAFATIEVVHKAVLEETRTDSELAEQEWKRFGRVNSLDKLSAEASVNMRPSPSGIEILVRYVTRATARYTVRNALYQRILEVMHKPAN